LNNRIFQQILIFTITILLFSPYLGITYAEVDENSWLDITSMQEERYGLGVVAENGKIYAIGGYSGSKPYLDVNEEYDPITEAWTYKTPIPEPMFDFGITVHNGKIYCFNGETGSTYVYTPLYDVWEKKASLPNHRKSITASTLEGKIYVIGGSSKILNVYDPTTDSWNTKAPLLYAFNEGYTRGCISVVFKNKIHVFGATPIEYSHQIYDPTSDSWSLGEPLIDGYSFALAGITTGSNAPERIYLFGMDGNLWTIEPPNLTSQSYDPVINNWTNIEPIPAGHLIGGIATINDKLYVIGGAGAGYSNAIYANSLSRVYTPIGYGSPDPSYTPPPQTPSPMISPEPFPATIIIVVIVVILLIGIGIFLFLKFK